MDCLISSHAKTKKLARCGQTWYFMFFFKQFSYFFNPNFLCLWMVIALNIAGSSFELWIEIFHPPVLVRDDRKAAIEFVFLALQKRYCNSNSISKILLWNLKFWTLFEICKLFFCCLLWNFLFRIQPDGFSTYNALLLSLL